MKEYRIGNGTFFTGDCFDVMRDLPDGSVDMILCDLPYGTTACKWDSVLPLDELWAEYRRVARPDAPIVLSAAQPFTTSLIDSNLKEFAYCWYWLKSQPTGFANAKKQPLRCVEDIVVFYRKAPLYVQQGLIRVKQTRRNSAFVGGDSLRGDTAASQGRGSLRTAGASYVQEFTNYPRQVLEFPRDRGFHPTQKPVALFEYLIRTYTNPGDLVLDNTAGSGTTAVAAENAGRRWICIERDADYAAKAIERIRNHVGESGDDFDSMLGIGHNGGPALDDFEALLG